MGDARGGDNWLVKLEKRHAQPGGERRQPAPAMSPRELRRRLLDPVQGVFLIQPRSLGRLIQQDVDSSILAGNVPDLDYYLITRDSFLRGLEEENPDALQVIEGLELPWQVILLPLPTPTELLVFERRELLSRSWAVRTEAEAARAWQRLEDEGARLPDEALRKLVGEVCYREIRGVLERDQRVLPAASDAHVVRCFVGMAVRFGLFEPSWRALYFPAIRDWARVDAWIASAGVDREVILEASRPSGVEGAPDDMQIRPLPGGREGPASAGEALWQAQAEAERQEQVAARPETPEATDEVVAESGYRFGHHARLWSQARLWRRREKTLYDLTVEEEERLCLPLVTGGLPSPGSVAQQALLVDFLETIFGALRFVVLYLMIGTVLRRLAPVVSRAMVASIALEGFAIRTHWRAACKASGRGNAGEVLRRLHEALWHNRTLQQGSGQAADEVGQALTSEADAKVEEICAQFMSCWALGADDAARLGELVRALADPTLPGGRMRKGRLLKDIYKASLDACRSFSRIQVVSWLRSLGREPLRASLEYQGQLKALRQLHQASKKLKKLPMSAAERARFSAPLAVAREETLRGMRASMVPKLEQAFRDSGLNPRTPRQELALRKICDELLDILARRWHLRCSDLRDAISRNDLRLEDPNGLELLKGDELTRLDDLLAIRLPGVYERAEIYILALQRVSTLLFATTVGRFLTRYLLIPYLGAYFVIVGLAHIVDPILRLASGGSLYLLAPHVKEGEQPKPPGALDEAAIMYAVVIAFGTLLLLVIHTKSGRDAARRLGGRISAGFRALVTAPLLLFRRWRGLQEVLRAGFTRRLSRYVLQPALMGLILTSPWLIYMLADPAGQLSLGWVLGLGFAGGFALINSRSGRDWLDTGFGTMTDVWKRTREHLLPDIFHYIMWVSDQALGLVEQVFYRVDDLLRFREGENPIVTAIKAVLQIIWSGITYLTRIYVNLLIEPQINPIKHFPVVTVSHKLMLTMLPVLLSGLTAFLLTLRLPAFLASSFAWITVFLLPGLFGFLVWEFKENWKLYKANQPTDIRPVIVGSHGETVRNLLRRGFHAGTVAKGYDKLRHALRSPYARRSRDRLASGFETLDHCQHDMEHFVDRELLVSLELTPELAGKFERIACGPVELATQSMKVSVQLYRRGEASRPLELAVHYYLVQGELEARVTLAGSTPSTALSVEEATAIAGQLDDFLRRSGTLAEEGDVRCALSVVS